MKTLARLLPLALILPALLCGCDTVRDTLGFQHNTPDEFAVATAPPLAIPPDYTLRPPQPGADPSQSVPAQAQAQAALIGNGTAQDKIGRTATPAAQLGGGEAALLQAAGSKPAVTANAGEDSATAPSMASPESQRLETALFGTPAGAANAPTISMQHSSWYNRWF